MRRLVGLPRAVGAPPRQPAHARRLPHMTAARIGTPIAPEVIERLRGVAGPGGALDDPLDIAPYCKSFRDGWEGRVPLVLRPQTTAAVAQIVRVCAEAGIGVVP